MNFIVKRKIRFRYVHLAFWKRIFQWWHIVHQWRVFLRRVLPAHWFVWYVKQTFKEQGEYGCRLPYAGKYQDKEKVDYLKELLARDIGLYIPESHRDKVEFRATIPKDFGRCKHIAWYYYPTNKSLNSHKYLEVSEIGGFIWV